MNEQILHFWQTLATVLVGIVVTLISFWVNLGKKIVSKDEITKMIQNETPYCRDREFIMERLANNKEMQTAFSLALQRNTEVMTELKIQIAMLGSTLEAIEYRIEK